MLLQLNLKLWLTHWLFLSLLALCLGAEPRAPGRHRPLTPALLCFSAWCLTASGETKPCKALADQSAAAANGKWVAFAKRGRQVAVG